MSKNNSGRVANISLIILCLSFQSMVTVGISLFLPLIRRDLDLSFTQGGALSATSTLVYALIQIPAGYLADRHGLRKIFFTGVLGTTILFLAFGLVFEYWHALLDQALTGFFKAFPFLSGLALMACWFSSHRRATAIGLSMIGITSGHILMNTLGPHLVELVNWRFPFIAFGSVGIVSSIMFLRYGKGPPREEHGQVVGMVDVTRLFRHSFMWICALIQYVRLGVLSGTSFWLPSLLIGEKGFSLQAAGFIMALRSLMIAPSNLVGGYVSDRLKKPVMIIGVSLCVLAITSASFVRVENKTLLIILISVNSFFVQLYFGPLFAAPVEKFGTYMIGTLSGFGNFFANLGGFTFTYLLGLLKDRSGYFASGFDFIALSCVIGLFFVFLMGMESRKELRS